MNALSDVPVYWLNFVLHTAAISVLAWIVLLMTRDPGRRAFVAAAGVLSIVVVPWMSATRMSAQPSVRNEITIAPVETQKWEGWTIRIEDWAPAVQVMDAMPMIGQEEEPAEPMDWEKLILMVWALGTAAGFGFVMLRQMTLVRWKKSLRPLSDDEQSVLGSAVKIDFKNVRSSDESVNPCVVGFFRPCMVIPAHLFESAQSDRLKWAAKHEAEHLRAGDPRWAVLLSVVRAILWWNPIVHRLCATWAEDREKVCDARAIGDVAERKSYGEFLLELAEANQVRGAIAMAANSPVSRLRRRLESIVLGCEVKKESAGFKVGSVVCITIIGLLVSYAGVKKLGAQETTVAEQETTNPSVVVEPRIAPPDAPPVPIEIGQNLKPFQIKLEISLIASAEKIPETGSTLKEEQRDLMMRRLAQTKGTSLMTTPSVIANSGQKAVIEIYRTDLKKQATFDDVREGPFVGLSCEMTPVDSDQGIEIAFDCQLNHVPGKYGETSPDGSWPKAPGEDFDWTTLRKTTAKVSKSILSGESMVVPFQGAEEGMSLIAVVRATLVDVTGAALVHAADMFDKPVWKEGQLRVRGAIFTLPKSGRLPSYWFDKQEGLENLSYLYPSGHWEKIRNEAVALEGADAWVELGSAVVSSETPSIPWEKFPLRIGVKPSDQKDIRLSLVFPGKYSEILTTAYLGYMMGVPREPTEDGRRRWLLLSFERAE